MIATWIGVPPCPHSPLHMTGTKECAVCWLLRMDEAKDDSREIIPFEAGDEDACWSDEIESVTHDEARHG